MSCPETPARVKKETAKVRSRVRRGEHMTETTSCHGREVSPRRTPAPGSLAIAERFHDGFGTPETPVRVVTLAPRPGSSRRPKRDAADRSRLSHTSRARRCPPPRSAPRASTARRSWRSARRAASPGNRSRRTRRARVIELGTTVRAATGFRVRSHRRNRAFRMTCSRRVSVARRRRYRRGHSARPTRVVGSPRRRRRRRRRAPWRLRRNRRLFARSPKARERNPHRRRF